MKIRDYTIDNRRIARLRKARDENDHISSGGLSASNIWWPLQWQILKSMGIFSEVDDYALGLFERGNEVEESCILDIPDVIERQKPVNYKGVVGIVDAIVDTKSFEKNYGIVPIEIKSVKNAKFTRILKADDSDLQYRLQATVYALALKSDHYGVVIKSADDGRVLTYFYQTADTADFVENVISEYSMAKQKGVVPEFSIRHDNFKWAEKETYNQYPEFMKLSSEEATKKALELINKGEK